MILCWKWLVPLAFAAFALCAGWVIWSPGRRVQLVIGVAMFAIFCVGLARFAQRVRFNLLASGGGVGAPVRSNGDMRSSSFL